MASTYVPIQSHTLGSSQSSVTFNSFSGYTDLVLVANGTITAGGGAACYLRVNGDTGSNYSDTAMYGDGSSAVSFREPNVGNIFTATFYPTQSTAIINLMNYANTSTYKTILARGSSQITDAVVGLWRNTAAITSITLFGDAGRSFDAGSTFTLYGIKAA